MLPLFAYMMLMPVDIFTPDILVPDTVMLSSATLPLRGPDAATTASVEQKAPATHFVSPSVPIAPSRYLSATPLFDTKEKPDHATLWRADDGLFYIDARINGTPVKLIVDTGASMTVLSPEDARRVGVDSSSTGPAETAETAGGSSRMSRVTLASMEVGPTSVNGVSAVVASQPLAFSLLGQNWLSRMGSVTIEGDRMILR